MNDLEYVGHPFSSVQDDLLARNIAFEVVKTSPANTKFLTDDNCLYVIRQQQHDGVLTLTVAAKMGKETS